VFFHPFDASRIAIEGTPVGVPPAAGETPAVQKEKVSAPKAKVSAFGLTKPALRKKPRRYLGSGNAIHLSDAARIGDAHIAEQSTKHLSQRD